MDKPPVRLVWCKVLCDCCGKDGAPGFMRLLPPAPTFGKEIELTRREKMLAGITVSRN